MKEKAAKIMAQFKVVKIDPKGSGMDWGDHLGKVFEGKRCCERCTIIFGTDGNFGPFVLGELEPLDNEAKTILNAILAFNEKERERKNKPPVEVIVSRSFQKALAEICGEVYFDAPTFEIKKGEA